MLRKKPKKQARSSFQKNSRKMALTRGILRLKISSCNKNPIKKPNLKNHFKILKSISTARGKLPQLNNYIEKIVTFWRQRYFHLSKSHLHWKYTVIYANGADYFKVNTSQNKANTWSIKSSHYSSTYTSTNVKDPQEKQ